MQFWAEATYHQLLIFWEIVFLTWKKLKSDIEDVVIITRMHYYMNVYYYKNENFKKIILYKFSKQSP